MVSARLGSSCVIGNSQPPQFNGQVTIYLAKETGIVISRSTMDGWVMGVGFGAYSRGKNTDNHLT